MPSDDKSVLRSATSSATLLIAVYTPPEVTSAELPFVTDVVVIGPDGSGGVINVPACERNLLVLLPFDCGTNPADDVVNTLYVVSVSLGVTNEPA